MDSFWVYMVASLFTEYVIFYFAYKILNKKINWIRMMTSVVLCDLIASPVVYFGLIYFNNGIWAAYGLDMTALVINILGMYFSIERNFAKIWIAGSFAYFIFYQSYLITLIFVPGELALGGSVNQMISIGLLLLASFFMGKLIVKVNAAFFLEWCMQRKKVRVIAGIVGYLLAGSTYYLLLLPQLVQDRNILLAVTGLGVLLLFCGGFEFTAKNIAHEEKEKIQDSIIVQQASYIQSLEEIQREVRVYRHDFKNLMAGMYLDVKEGKTAALEQYMQGMLNEFDQNLGNRIQLANQMVHVNIVELKSLLMTKICQMRREKIPYHVEILYPVEECRMEIRDLNRCVGILLDNAIEAAREVKGDVEIIVTSHGEEVVILISNPVIGEISMSKIWKKGYSTKGENRGLGLYSYQQITQSYDNVSCSTRCRDGRFYQELRIGGGYRA